MKTKLLSLAMALLCVLGLCVSSACTEREETPPVETPPVETVTVFGRFYTVREAYENDFFERETLRFIGDNLKTPENYVPMDDERKEKIMHDYDVTHVIKSEQLEFTNYGCYGGCTVFRIIDKYYDNGFEDFRTNGYPIYTKDKRPYFDFNLPGEFASMLVWKEVPGTTEVEKPQKPSGEFFSLKKAYEYGFVTKEYLEGFKHSDGEICLIHKAPDPPEWEVTAEKIKQDYLLQDINGYEWVDVEYHGEFNGCLLVRVKTDQYADPYGRGEGHGIEDFKIHDNHPKCVIWRAFDEQLLQGEI